MIKFAGNYLPHYVRINDIKYDVLAPIEHKTGSIQGRTGVFDFGIENGYKAFEMSYQIIAESESDIIVKARDFATWLHYEDLQELVFLDDPNKFYMARVAGDTQLTEEYTVGKGSLTFIVPSGYAERVTEKIVTASPTNTDPYFVMDNEGTADTYPVIQLTMKSDVENISVVSNENFVRVGDLTKDGGKVKPETLIYSDQFTTFTGWTSGPSVDDGTVTGSFAVDGGQTLKQSGDNYGTGSRWHGASAYKALSEQLQDFVVQSRIYYDAGTFVEKGRIEIYLLDVDNVVIGKFGLNDSYNNVKKKTLGAKLFARAGSSSGGKEFADPRSFYIAKKGKKKGYYEDFNDIGHAYISLRRVGKKWTLYFADLKNGDVLSHYNKKTWTYTDSKNLFSSKKLAKIQIHVGAFSTDKPVKTMKFTDLKVYRVNSVSAADTRLDLEAGDTILIDNSRAVVERNGVPFFTSLDPSSDFFALEPGVNQLAITPAVADVKVTYRERYK